MKLNKILSILFTLCIVVVAAIFTLTNTYSAKNKLLMENVEALANYIKTQSCLPSAFFNANEGAPSQYTICAKGTTSSESLPCPSSDQRGYADSGAVYYVCTR